MVQPGGLADHEQAMRYLVFMRHAQKFGRAVTLAEFGVAVDPLGGDPRPPDIERLKPVMHRVRISALGIHPTFFGQELVHHGRADHPRGMARRTFQKHRALYSQGEPLVVFQNGPGRHGLLGQDIAGPDNHPDPGAARRQL